MDEREFQYYLHFRARDKQREAARERLINSILQGQRQARNHQRENLLRRAWSIVVQWWAARRDQLAETESAQSPEQTDCQPAEALKVTLS